MIDDDPFAPPVKKPVPLEAQLENASVDELEHRIEKLKAEIGLCERAIAAKKAQRAAAEFRVRRQILMINLTGFGPSLATFAV